MRQTELEENWNRNKNNKIDAHLYNVIVNSEQQLVFYHRPQRSSDNNGKPRSHDGNKKWASSVTWNQQRFEKHGVSNCTIWKKRCLDHYVALCIPLRQGEMFYIFQYVLKFEKMSSQMLPVIYTYFCTVVIQ